MMDMLYIIKHINGDANIISTEISCWNNTLVRLVQPQLGGWGRGGGFVYIRYIKYEIGLVLDFVNLIERHKVSQ